MKSVNFALDSMQKKSVKPAHKNPTRNEGENWALVSESAFPLMWQMVQQQSAQHASPVNQSHSGEIPIAMPRTLAAGAKNETSSAAGTARIQTNAPFPAGGKLNAVVNRALNEWTTAAAKGDGLKVQPGSVAQVNVSEMSVKNGTPGDEHAIKSQESPALPNNPTFAKGFSGASGGTSQTLFFVFKGGQGWQAVGAAEGKQLAQKAPTLMRMVFAPAQKAASGSASKETVHLTAIKTENSAWTEAPKTRQKTRASKEKSAGRIKKQSVKIQVFSEKQGSEGKTPVKKAESSAAQNTKAAQRVPTEQNMANNPNMSGENPTANEFSEQLSAKMSVSKRAAQSGAKAHSQTGMGTVIAGQAKFAGKMQALSQVASRHRVLIQRIQKMVMDTQGASGRPVGSIRLQLMESPYGQMDVHYDKEQDKLTVVVESEKARQAFLKLVPVIQSSLNDKGVLLGSFDVQINQFAAQEKQEQSNKRNNSGQTNSQIGKEVQSHEIDSAVTKRNFGYNTMEVIA